jgi:hypothetical protein
MRSTKFDNWRSALTRRRDAQRRGTTVAMLRASQREPPRSRPMFQINREPDDDDDVWRRQGERIRRPVTLPEVQFLLRPNLLDLERYR